MKGFLEEVTPWTLLSNQRPDFTYLRTFGADCYEAIPQDRKSTYDKFSKTKNLLGAVKTRRWLYLGFSDDRIGMRVFDPETREVATRWHLTFNEAAMHQRTAKLREFDTQMESYKKGRWETLHPLVADDYDEYNATPHALQDALRFRSIFQDHTRNLDRNSRTAPSSSSNEEREIASGSAGAVDHIDMPQSAEELEQGSAGVTSQVSDQTESPEAANTHDDNDGTPGILHQMNKAPIPKPGHLEEPLLSPRPQSVVMVHVKEVQLAARCGAISGTTTSSDLSRFQGMSQLTLTIS